MNLIDSTNEKKGRERLPIFDGVLKDNDFLSIKNSYNKEGVPFMNLNIKDIFQVNQ